MKSTQQRHDHTPPRAFVRLLKTFCNDHLAEAVLGDLEELHQRRLESGMGKTKAHALFALNVITFLQPFAIRKQTYAPINNMAMLKNYVKIAWRNMNRQGMYSGITIGGFALGLATCLLIYLYIRDEMSYDKSNATGDRTYRIFNEVAKGDVERWIAMPAPVGGILRDEYPDIELSGRLIPYNWYNAGSNLVKKADDPENMFEEGFAYADPSLLELLDIPMVYGTREHALSKPFTIVISRKAATKYFGTEDPVGKILVLNNDNSKSYQVGGVMEDFPSNSHINYDFLLTLADVEFWPGEQASWCCWNYDTYVRLRPGVSVADVEKKVSSMRDDHLVAFMREAGDQNLQDVQQFHSFRFQRLADVYLNPEGISDIHRHGNIKYLWMFGGIAGFILVLACINFVNLSTARSAKRAREVGLRKAVGSVRSSLIRQFLTESVFYSVLSFVVAIAISYLALPYFNLLAGKNLSMPWMTTWFIPMLITVCLGVGLFAGLYPAFYLSAFKPVDVLKGSFIRGRSSAGLRSSMVVFQFATSIVLIISTIVINRQMDHIMGVDIGFNKDQVLMIQGANTLHDRGQEFKDELLQLADVSGVTRSNYLPVSGTKRDQNGFYREGRTQIDKGVGAQCWYVDNDYVSTMGMKLIAGRDFDRDLQSDTASIIINQSMAKAMELDHPLGARIENYRAWTVIGVVEDFRFESMREKIEPLALVRSSDGAIISVRARGSDMQSLVGQITAKWNAFMPHQPFRYTFLDEQFARMYDDVNRTGKLFAVAAGLAIAIACLGLFALSSFMIEQRGKEISVRLVLGASMGSILRLLGSNFVKLIAISFLISIPLGWYIMDRWLSDFSERIPVSWDIFVIAGITALMIASLTITYQSVKAALVNPATKLRAE